MTSLRNRRDRCSTSKVLAEELRAENWEETHGKNKNSHTSKNNSASYTDPPRVGGGVGVTPYNGLYGEVPPKRGTLFRLQVCERVRISLLEV